MREIKFRAWDKRNNKWIHPDLFIITNAGFYKDHRAFEDGISLFDYEYELMQYTGLNDKNSKEIYEGDIIRFVTGGNEYISKVWFGEDCGCYLVRTSTDILFDHAKRNAEVIGNIYENSEFIKITPPH